MRQLAMVLLASIVTSSAIGVIAWRAGVASVSEERDRATAREDKIVSFLAEVEGLLTKRTDELTELAAKRDDPNWWCTSGKDAACQRTRADCSEMRTANTKGGKSVGECEPIRVAYCNDFICYRQLADCEEMNDMLRKQLPKFEHKMCAGVE